MTDESISNLKDLSVPFEIRTIDDETDEIVLAGLLGEKVVIRGKCIEVEIV